MKFRDVSAGLRILRDFLLGNREPHQLHNRFNPLLAPRTLPRPDIARSPELKYSDQYYYDRNPINSVKPPVVAPIALGIKESKPSKQLSGKQQPGAKPCPEGELVFPSLPTPGPPYWWDGHCYFECVADEPPPTKSCPPPRQSPPPTTTCDPCAKPAKKC